MMRGTFIYGEELWRNINTLYWTFWRWLEQSYSYGTLNRCKLNRWKGNEFLSPQIKISKLVNILPSAEQVLSKFLRSASILSVKQFVNPMAFSVGPLFSLMYWQILLLISSKKTQLWKGLEEFSYSFKNKSKLSNARCQKNHLRKKNKTFIPYRIV